jgi:hypothetical protein
VGRFKQEGTEANFEKQEKEEEMIGATCANTAGGFVIVAVGLAAYVFIIALVIVGLVRASRYFMTAGKEQKLTRIEVGKLAEEVYQLRQELKDAREPDSSAESK